MKVQPPRVWHFDYKFQIKNQQWSHPHFNSQKYPHFSILSLSLFLFLFHIPMDPYKVLIHILIVSLWSWFTNKIHEKKYNLIGEFTKCLIWGSLNLCNVFLSRKVCNYDHYGKGLYIIKLRSLLNMVFIFTW